MLSIKVKGDGEEATRVADRLRLFALAPEERARRGIFDAMLRLSVGLEDADDLIADLVQALA